MEILEEIPSDELADMIVEYEFIRSTGIIDDRMEIVKFCQLHYAPSSYGNVFLVGLEVHRILHIRHLKEMSQKRALQFTLKQSNSQNPPRRC